MRVLLRRVRAWAAVPHPLEWGCLLVGAILVVQYDWIMDDAFVYFRYVDNLLFLDLGLVYNPGEYIEGYSSPAWVILLAVLRWLELRYGTILLGLGLAALFAIWCMLVMLRRRQSPQGPVLNLPMVFLLPNYAFLCYLTSGVDTPLVLLAGVACALFVVHPTSIPLQVLITFLPLIRHELVISYGLCILWLWYLRRRFPWHLAVTGTIALTAWIAFRVYYYADFFPNTFYLKNEVHLRWGILYLHDTMVAYHAYEILALAAAAALTLRLKRIPLQWAERGMMLLLALPVLLYVIKIGGDARHFRYLAFPYCLLICAFGGVPERLWSALGWRRPALLLPATGLLLALVTFTSYPRQLDRHPLRDEINHQSISGINDAEVHRKIILPRFPDWEDRVTPDILREFRMSSRFEQPWQLFPNEICLENYVYFDRHIVHTYGLTDAILARANVPARRPGHKEDLRVMGKNLARLEEIPEADRTRMVSRAAERRMAPSWVLENLNVIRAIENKVYNRHDFGENLRLALRPTGQLEIRPGSLRRGAKDLLR
jgi:hypothetical protein